MYYLEIIAAIGLKVGLNIQMNELMMLNEYQRSLRFQNEILFFSETVESFRTKFHIDYNQMTLV